MSFARARARKLKKDAGKGDKRAIREVNKAKQTVRMTDAQRFKLENEYRKEVIANLWLIYRYTMHALYGFGRQRQLRLTEKTWNEFEAIMKGNINVVEIDQFLRSEVKFSCGLSVIDKNASRDKQIEDKAIRDLSAAFLMALLDEFNFKSRRMVKICKYAFEINKKIMNGEITYPFMRVKIKKVMERGLKK